MRFMTIPFELLPQYVSCQCEQARGASAIRVLFMYGYTHRRPDTRGTQVAWAVQLLHALK